MASPHCTKPRRVSTQVGPNNPFWKGGRPISSNGYVLIRVGIGHPLADVRGYAYEHRIVAQEKIGRSLLPNEQVHHIDGNKQNNAPENLEVMQDTRHHSVRHRTSGKAKRMPDEPNPTIECACGCGTMFDKYDDTNRPRLYITGHNPRPARTRTAIIECLKAAPQHYSQIAAITGISVQGVKVALTKMVRQRQVYRVSQGIYAIGAGE